MRQVILKADCPEGVDKDVLELMRLRGDHLVIQDISPAYEKSARVRITLVSVPAKPSFPAGRLVPDGSAPKERPKPTEPDWVREDCDPRKRNK